MSKKKKGSLKLFLKYFKNILKDKRFQTIQTFWRQLSLLYSQEMIMNNQESKFRKSRSKLKSKIRMIGKFYIYYVLVLFLIKKKIISIYKSGINEQN